MTERTAILKSLPFFSGLEPDLLEKVSSIARIKKLDRGQTLFRQGEPAAGMFFLVEGSIKIFKLSPDGKEHILHIIKSGQSFAEAALFMPQGYPAHAEALLKSTLVLLPKDAFLEMLSSDPRLSIGIIASLSGYLRKFADRIEDLALKDVSSRFARWVLAKSEETGRDFWELEITKGQLAGQIGTVNETMSRTLKRFKDAGWLVVRGKFMKIIDRRMIEMMAEGDESSHI